MTRISTKMVVIIGLVVSAVLASVISFYASSRPDGLESVAETQGFAGTATDHALGNSPFADYAATGISDERLSGGLAGLVGIALTALLAFGLVMLLKRRAPSHRAGEPLDRG